MMFLLSILLLKEKVLALSLIKVVNIFYWSAMLADIFWATL